jgi:hypothetical protein
MAAHRLPDVTVVADAGMISEANQKAIEAEGLSFILEMKVPDVPYLVDQWRREHPGEKIPDGHVFVQPWPAGPSLKRRDQWIHYQYRADRARRTLRGIDEQVAKAAKAVAGLAPVKRNRFIALDGAVKSVNRELARLTIVFAALAVSRWIETVTGWSIRRFVRTARRYRTIQIQAGQHTVTAADPIPDDLRQALSAINAPAEMRTSPKIGPQLGAR